MRDIPATEIIKTLIEHEKENNTFIRHYEDVRFKITQINVTLSVLLIGASRFGTLQSSKILLSAFIIILGVHGVLVCAKYTERADRHAVISRAYRQALSEFVGNFDDTTLEEIHQNASERHRSHKNVTGIFVNIRARWFWAAVHFAVVILGIFVAIT
jgi:hypothetical protein